MASYTRQQLIDLFQDLSPFLSDLTDEAVGQLIDAGLRTYSHRCPAYKVSAGNAVDTALSTQLYDYPSGALRIHKVWETNTKREIRFSIETREDTPQIRLYYIHQPSTQSLMDISFYTDPVNNNTVEAAPLSFSSFDIEYAVLQTASTLPDSAVDPLLAYCEAVAIERRTETLLDGLTSDSFSQVTDTDPTGATTMIEQGAGGTGFGTTLNTLYKMARDKRKVFTDATKRPYGTRG